MDGHTGCRRTINDLAQYCMPVGYGTGGTRVNLYLLIKRRYYLLVYHSLDCDRDSFSGRLPRGYCGIGLRGGGGQGYNCVGIQPVAHCVLQVINNNNKNISSLIRKIKNIPTCINYKIRLVRK